MVGIRMYDTEIGTEHYVTDQTLKPSWPWTFFPIWIGQAFSLVGSSIAHFGLVWWITEQTGSATVLAMAGLAAMLPGILLGPLAGVLVDRWNRKTVMMLADATSALLAGLLAYLFWMNSLHAMHIYVILFLRSLAGTLHFTAMTASTTLMVPRMYLTRIAGANQTLRGITDIVSPPIGALLVSSVPLQYVMLIDVVTAIFAILPLFLVYVPQPEQSLGTRKENTFSHLWRDMVTVGRFIWGWSGLMIICLLAALTNFLVAPAFQLLPLTIKAHFGGGPLELGWANTAWGIGTVLGGMILGVWGGFQRRIITILGGLAGFGAGILIVGITPSHLLGLALSALFVAGVLNAMCNASAIALMQDLIPAQMQGRIFSLVSSFTGLMMPLGMAIAGPLSDHLGYQFWYLLGGVLSIAAALIGFSIPSVVHLESDAHRYHRGLFHL